MTAAADTAVPILPDALNDAARRRAVAAVSLERRRHKWDMAIANMPPSLKWLKRARSRSMLMGSPRTGNDMRMKGTIQRRADNDE